jgi:DNA-binding transcriptional ArsR family regulator
LHPSPSAFAGAHHDQTKLPPQGTTNAMLDQLRQQIQTYLDELLGEADKLRRALGALGSRDGAATPSPSATPSTAPERAGQAPRSRTATRKPARPRASASSAVTSPSPQPAEAPASAPAARRARAVSGSTKTAVLEALSGGNAMTAGDVATATGLGRASVSTTLSKLAKSGEVIKATRGYQLAGQTAAGAPDAAASTESEQPAG